MLLLLLLLFVDNLNCASQASIWYTTSCLYVYTSNKDISASLEQNDEQINQLIMSAYCFYRKDTIKFIRSSVYEELLESIGCTHEIKYN